MLLKKIESGAFNAKYKIKYIAIISIVSKKNC